MKLKPISVPADEWLDLAGFADATCWVEPSDERSPPPEKAEAPCPLPFRGTRVLLDTLLEAMPIDLRTVFVLYEIEELTMIEIASVLELPSGTVASRLRRARQVFQELSRQARERMAMKERA